jgi:hypothetical protein
MPTPVLKRRSWVFIPVLVLSAGTVLSACGSGTSANSAAIKSACEKVGAALSDGPDPTADPVGYAEAQVLPLKEIKVDDPALQKAIYELDAAYKSYFDASGLQSTSVPLKQALTRVETFCPGVAQ